MASPVAAADVTPASELPSAPTPQTGAAASVEELGEIVVRGKRLQQEIADAEDEFFDLFNTLNQDEDYDTRCVHLNTSPGSAIQSRVCIPGFVANAMADWTASRYECSGFANYDLNMDGRLSVQEARELEEVAPDILHRFSLFDSNGDGYLSVIEFAERMATPIACYQAPPPELVLMEGTQDWYDHMTAMVESDPRLKQMASRLGDLYYELRASQRRYVEVEEQVRSQTPTRRHRGPRAR